MNTKAKLIYISGPGHSGTTLLDLVCGSIPKVFSMGEVHFLSWQLKQGANEDDPQTWCSCGEDFGKCKVYGPILHGINLKQDINIFNNPEKYNFTIVRKLERYKESIFKRIINKILLLSISHKFLNVFSYIPYLLNYKSIKRNWDLFDQVANNTNSLYVVDSSKSFLRFWLLKMYRPNDVKLLVVKRDLKGVASSSHEGLNDKIIDSKIYRWLRFYNKSVKGLKNIDSSTWKLIKYENLCEDPVKTKNEISIFLNLIVNSENKDLIIRPYSNHTIQGNPMRLLKKDVTIIYDERWKNRLNSEQVKRINRLSKNIPNYFQ